MKTKSVLAFIFISIFSFALLSAIAPLNDHHYDLAKGKIVFEENCSGCHGMKGEGGFGPNLTDDYYLHGHHYHNVVHTIKHGNKKGMTAFAHHLSHHQIKNVAHYVMSLRGTNPPNAKAPQGKLHKHK